MRRKRLCMTLAILTALASATVLLSACQHSGEALGNPESPITPTSAAQKDAAPAIQLVAYTPSSTFKPLQTCNLGMVNATTFRSQPVELKASDTNTFKGWLYASELVNPTYWLRFDGQQANSYLHTPLQLRVERPDVLAVHPDAPRVSGFTVAVPANMMPTGEYHVYLAVESGDTTYICDSGRHINVTD